MDFAPETAMHCTERLQSECIKKIITVIGKTDTRFLFFPEASLACQSI